MTPQYIWTCSRTINVQFRLENGKDVARLPRHRSMHCKDLSMIRRQSETVCVWQNSCSTSGGLWIWLCPKILLIKIPQPQVSDLSRPRVVKSGPSLSKGVVYPLKRCPSPLTSVFELRYILYFLNNKIAPMPQLYWISSPSPRLGENLKWMGYIHCRGELEGG